MIRARFVFISFIVFSFQGLIAQKVYTMEDAVAIALKNNYGILMAKNDSAISANEWFVGNAGMLPSIGFNAGINRASNNLNQRFSTGLEVNKNGVGSANTTAAIVLGWTVFDGFKMFASYHKLESLYEGGKLQLKTIAENTTQNTIQLYQNCIQVKQKSKTIENLIVIFEERLKIASMRLEIGNGNKSELLQAQLDLNAQKSALIQTRIEVEVIKQDLANQMGLGDADFEIQDTYNPAAITETLQQYAERLNKNNPEILLALNHVNTLQWMAKETRSAMYPTLRLGTSYNFGRSSSDAGFALYSQTAGLSYGITLNYALFDGGKVRHSVRSANLQLQNALIALDAEKNWQYHQLVKAFANLRAAAEWMALEEQNIVLAKEHVQIMMERYRLGECTSPEMKDAQQSFVDAEFRLLQARFQGITAQTNLRRIDGHLVP